MVFVCPVQPERQIVDARRARELELLHEFLVRLRHLQEQLNETCTQLSDRMKRAENLSTAADYYLQVGRVDSLGNIFYKIKCEMIYEMEKVQGVIPGHLLTIAQQIKGNSSEKHRECLELSKRLQRLGDEILDSKSRPCS